MLKFEFIQQNIIFYCDLITFLLNLNLQLNWRTNKHLLTLNMTRHLIIGGGVHGLTIARELHQRGEKEIVITEKTDIGDGASLAAAGMLSPQAEADKETKLFHFCLEGSKLYPNFAAELEDQTGLEIDYDTNGTLCISFNSQDSAELTNRYQWQKKLGLEIEQLSAIETHKLEPFISPNSKGALLFPNDRQVDNRKLVAALRAYCNQNGIKIITNSAIEEVENCGKIIKAISSTGKIYEADNCIISGGAWSSKLDINGTMSAYPILIPIRGQMISFHTAKRLIEHVIYSPRGYVVPRKDGAILCGATVEDVGFDNQTTIEGIESLKESTFEISPAISSLQIDDAWSGLRPTTEDGLPLIGEVSGGENIFIASAHYRNGILLAPVTAKILVDRIIDGEKSAWLDYFAPDRKSAFTSL